MIDFVKMQGLGNDFVVVGTDVAVTTELVTSLCDRRFGIGADGLLRVSSDDGQVRMEYWNADGSEAEMCGNGFRCVARYAFDRGLTSDISFRVTTPSGQWRAEIEAGDSVLVELGPVTLEGSIELHGRSYQRVSVGNPHAVTLVDDLGEIDVAGDGHRVGTDHSHFPQGTNVEFVRLLGPAEAELRVWERGVGETLACGSGIVATAAVVAALSGATEPITVTTRGGAASAFARDGSWFLRGPARYSFVGNWRG